MIVAHAKNITIADATGTVTGWFGSSTVSVAASDIQLPSDWNSAHVGVFFASGNTTVSTSGSGSVGFGYSGAGGISVGYDTANDVMIISGPTGGGGGVTLNNWRPFQLGDNSSFSSLGQNSLYLQHFIPEERVEFSSIELWARGSFVSSTNSQVYAHTIRYGLYSQNTGASTSQMTLMSSSSQLMTVSYNSNTAAGVTVSGGGTSFTTTSGGTALIANISGAFHHYLPFSGTVTPNVKYAQAFAISSATTVGTSPFRYAPLVMTIMNSLSMGRLFSTGSAATATTAIGDREMGVYSATTGGLPSTYATSQLSIAVSRQIIPVQFEA